MAKHESREDTIFQNFKTKIAQEPEQVKQSSYSSTLCSFCGCFRGVIPKEAMSLAVALHAKEGRFAVLTLQELLKE